MKVKRKPLLLHNVISTKVIGNAESWKEASEELRNAIVRNDLYATGPILYQIKSYNESNAEYEFIIYIPLNSPISLKENEQFDYIEELHIEDGFTIRHTDLEDDINITYDLLKTVATVNLVELEEPFYNIYLPVFGSGVIDVYAKVKK